MIKKTIVAISAACIIIGSIASMCLAGQYYYGEGVIQVYNGERAWVDFGADNNNDWYVKVYVKKNNVLYGYKRTAVYRNCREVCYSLTVPGSDGVCEWDKEIKTGYGK